jgi:two-component sensor histidine kinase
MIMSLVYMQERKTDTDEVKENMQQIRLRIESIANLHEQLMHQADSVDLYTYVQQLVANVSKLLNDNKNIITHLQIASLQVPQKTSFALGLILNEWITVKYATVDNTALELFIEISIGNNQIKVQYRDNGIPQILRPENNSLGLDIVHLLTAQLNAKMETAADNAFSYSLIIPTA